MCDDYSSVSCGHFLKFIKNISKRKALPGDDSLRKKIKVIYDEYSRYPFAYNFYSQLKELSDTTNKLPLLDSHNTLDDVYTNISILKDISNKKEVSEHIKNTIGIFGEPSIEIIDIFNDILKKYEIELSKFEVYNSIITRQAAIHREQQRLAAQATTSQATTSRFTAPQIQRHECCSTIHSSDTHFRGCTIECVIPSLNSISICHVGNTIYLAYSGISDIIRKETFIRDIVDNYADLEIIIATKLPIDYIFPYKYKGTVDPIDRTRHPSDNVKPDPEYNCYNGIMCSEPKLFTYIKEKGKEEHKELIRNGKYNFGCIYIGKINHEICNYIISDYIAANESKERGRLRERVILSNIFYHSNIDFFNSLLWRFTDRKKKKNIITIIKQNYKVILRLMKPCIGCLMNHKQILDMDNTEPIEWDNTDCLKGEIMQGGKLPNGRKLPNKTRKKIIYSKKNRSKKNKL